MKVSYGKDGVVALTSPKSYVPIGFWRKGTAMYEVNLMPIKDGEPDYSRGYCTRANAVFFGTTIYEERRKDATAEIEKILQKSVAA